jgi:hypothetical protein
MPQEKPYTIGQLTDAMYRVREEKKRRQKKVDECQAKYNELQELLFEALDSQDSRKGEGKEASASISTSVEPTVTDWDKVNKFVLRHKHLDLFQKRLAPAVFRELLEEHPRGIPGIEPREVRRINLRKL